MDEFNFSEESNDENNENKINTNPNNASFTIETLLHSREDYDKCFQKYDSETLKRFCFLYVDNNMEKLTNKISPYIKQKITWATVYEKIFRKIFMPFSMENGEQYVTLEEIYDRINLIVHGEINNKYKNTYIIKEEKNSIPSIINYFSYNTLQIKKNDKKVNESDSEKDDNMKNCLINSKKKSSTSKNKDINLNKQISNSSDKNNSINKNNEHNNISNRPNKIKNINNVIEEISTQKKIENKNNEEKDKANIEKHKYKRLSSFNLDHLQRVYDNLNRQKSKNSNSPIPERPRKIKKTNSLKEISNKSQNSNNNSIINNNNDNLNDSKNLQNNELNKKENSSENQNNKKNEENNHIQKHIITEKTNKTLDSIINKKKYSIAKEEEKEIRNIPRREMIKKNLYKKVDKLAYKDELEYFNRVNIKSSLKDKIFCSLTPMINFIGDNNIPDRDTDLKKRGNNLLMFKQMADDLMNIIHN